MFKKKKLLCCLQKWTSVTTELGTVWVRLMRFSRCLSTHSTITGRPIFSSEYDDCVPLALVPLPAGLLVLSCYFNFTPLAFVNQGRCWRCLVVVMMMMRRVLPDNCILMQAKWLTDGGSTRGVLRKTGTTARGQEVFPQGPQHWGCGGRGTLQIGKVSICLVFSLLLSASFCFCSLLFFVSTYRLFIQLSL